MKPYDLIQLTVPGYKGERDAKSKPYMFILAVNSGDNILVRYPNGHPDRVHVDYIKAETLLTPRDAEYWQIFQNNLAMQRELSKPRFLKLVEDYAPHLLPEPEEELVVVGEGDSEVLETIQSDIQEIKTILLKLITKLL